jgi:hypothetical protein
MSCVHFCSYHFPSAMEQSILFDACANLEKIGGHSSSSIVHGSTWFQEYANKDILESFIFVTIRALQWPVNSPVRRAFSNALRKLVRKRMLLRHHSGCGSWCLLQELTCPHRYVRYIGPVKRIVSAMFTGVVGVTKDLMQRRSSNAILV